MSKVTLYEVPEDFAQSDESTDYDARAYEVKKVTLERNQFFRAGGGVLWFGDKKSALNHMANLPSKKEYYSK